MAPKVLVLGNCQARPLSMLLNRFAGFELLDPIILHLAKEADHAEHEDRIAGADLVLSQLTASVFRPAHLRSEELKKRHPEKTLIWPNLFFAGQQPYLRYLTHATRGRILGPIDATHDMRLLRAWFMDRAGISFREDIAAEGYEKAVADRSLNDLRQREASCDLGVTDLIEAEIMTRKLFFTFNHPSIWLLSRMAERILARLEIPGSIDDASLKEPLGTFQPPSSLPRLNAPAPIQGVEVNLDTPGQIGVGPKRHYSPEELQQAAFACYDHIREHLHPEALRLTPAY